MRDTGSNPTPDQERDIVSRRSRLQDKVDTFQNQAASMLHAISNDGDDSWGDNYTRDIYSGAEFDGVGEEDDDDGLDSAAEEHYQAGVLAGIPHDRLINAEHISLHLPSHMGRTWCNANSAQDLADAELRL